ncbi:helix-turn-helix domain-containing protein [Flammeovirga aprica]|uniref:Helix-turn-helix transcriptional regulator n=1 Tax=Flammeovirga aprica JL-4 TaxID=694437 RepID=A0A7X9RU65_9BACT|nr:AraC family transcriptional regulator [Flammeovirga aprica]NME68783.1 helix-turn-helix transcriptional regulator [Flammeovirga aprica JL-4]
MEYILNNKNSGDPSISTQRIDPLRIEVLCCRLWWLKKWKNGKLSSPYWRLYWNMNKGAYIAYEGRKIEITPNKLVLIPPNTTFETYIDGNNEISENKLMGGVIHSDDDIEECMKKNNIIHLFIHFNLGGELDHFKKNIYEIPLCEIQNLFIQEITEKTLSNNDLIQIHTAIKIHQLILSTIQSIGEDELLPQQLHPRIVKVIEFINQEYHRVIDNAELADFINMATNSFTRFFKENMHLSPQEYIKNVRINKACYLIENADLSFDFIAQKVGFSDRYHFSKVFKSVKGIPPAQYKKQFIRK